MNLPVTIESLAGIRDQLSVEEHSFGCSNEFLQTLWDITNGNIEGPANISDGLGLYTVLEEYYIYC